MNNLTSKKPYFSVSLEMQRRNRRLIEKKINELNTFLNTMNLEFINNLFHLKEKNPNNNFLNARVILYRNNQPQQWSGDRLITDSSTQSEEKELENKYTQTYNDNEYWLFKCLQAKDELSISDDKLLQFSKLFTNKTPKDSGITQGYLNKFKKKIGSFLGPINKVELSNNLIGYYFDIKIKVEYFVSRFIEKYLADKERVDKNIMTLEDLKKKYLIIEDSTILLKFGGDGLQISKTNRKLFNFSFSIVNDDLCNSERGTFVLGLFELEKENYTETLNRLELLFEQMKNITELKYKNIVYKLKIFLFGDLKFLANIFGIKQANADQACLYCTFNYKLKQQQKIQVVNQRSMEQVLIMAENNKFIDGYSKIPAQTFIDFEYAIFDLLHLKLRIFDKLSEFFLDKLMELDGPVKSYSLNDRPNTAVFYDFLKNICKIHKPIYINQKMDKVMIRSLSGYDLEKLFSKFITKVKVKETGIEDYINAHKNRSYPALIEEKNRIPKEENRKLSIYFGSTDLTWIGFYKLYLISKKNLNDIDIDQLELKLKKWEEYYGRIEKTDKLTPYSHIFIFHTVAFLRKYKNLSRFQAQGLESLNNNIQKSYFSSTNQKDCKKSHFVHQLLKKRNRIELYSVGLELFEIDYEFV